MDEDVSRLGVTTIHRPAAFLDHFAAVEKLRVDAISHWDALPAPDSSPEVLSGERVPQILEPIRRNDSVVNVPLSDPPVDELADRFTG